MPIEIRVQDIDPTELSETTLSMFRAGIVHDYDFEIFRKLKGSGHVVLDVGANRGQSISSLSLTMDTPEIHSFEVNPDLFAALNRVKQEFGTRVHLYPFGLGNADANLNFFTPIIDGKRMLEYTTVSIDEFNKPWVKARIFDQCSSVFLEWRTGEVRVGDSLGLKPRVIKVDVEGFELSVLKGLEKTIQTYFPILMIENSDWHNVTEYLAQWNYLCFQYIHESNSIRQLEGTCTNSFYLRPEHVEELGTI